MSLDFTVLSSRPLSSSRSLTRLSAFHSLQHSLVSSSLALTGDNNAPSVKPALGQEKLDQLAILLSKVEEESNKGSIEDDWIQQMKDAMNRANAELGMNKGENKLTKANKVNN